MELAAEMASPTFKTEAKLPFIPLETEIDQLIAHCGKHMETLLQFLKETGIRKGEATQIKLSDIDAQHKLVIITPEKGSNGRVAHAQASHLNAQTPTH